MSPIEVQNFAEPAQAVLQDIVTDIGNGPLSDDALTARIKHALSYLDELITAAQKDERID